MPRARTMLLALLASGFALFCACSAALLAGCLDDGEPPWERVDFITFASAGTYREEFVDQVFSSGEVAFDVLDENQRFVWMIGPGRNLVPGTDHDQAPYPNPMHPRKFDPRTTRFDKRYWTQFAGGVWRSVGIEVDKESRLRASASPAPFVPRTVFTWCPSGGGCKWWSSAVHDESVRCWKWNERGTAKRTDRLTCLGFHPRTHWRVDPCDDCPLPAVRGEESGVQDQAPDATRRDVIGWGSEVDAGGQGVEPVDHPSDVADHGVVTISDAHPLVGVSGLGVQDDGRRLGAHGQFVEVVGDDVAHRASVAPHPAAGQGAARP
jgi:hypothetical protein